LLVRYVCATAFAHWQLNPLLVRYVSATAFAHGQLNQLLVGSRPSILKKLYRALSNAVWESQFPGSTPAAAPSNLSLKKQKKTTKRKSKSRVLVCVKRDVFH
jgi:hypothetical protein